MSIIRYIRAFDHIQMLICAEEILNIIIIIMAVKICASSQFSDVIASRSLNLQYSDPDDSLDYNLM